LNSKQNLSPSNSEYLPVIILENNDYLISIHSIVPFPFLPNDKQYVLPIKNCILVGGEGDCSVTFDDDLHVTFVNIFVAYNISFHSRFTNCHFLSDSVVKLAHCSFESSNHTYTSFSCFGKLKVHSCKFYNCTKGGLLVVGNAEIENTEFFGNGVALEVREGGHLLVRESKMYGNLQGLLIGPNAKECVVEDCELYDNEWGGVYVTNSASGVVIKRNRIYDNDQPGVTVLGSSNVSILENEILRNNDWGITIVGHSHVFVKENKIHNNQSGGISLKNNSLVEKSVIEYNDISSNSGPGIYEEGSLTKRRENKLQDNKEERNQSTAQSETKLCYCCKKPEVNLRKCTNCYTAQYCGKQCQKSDWGNHKEVCYRLLSDASIVLNYIRDPIMTVHLPINEQELQISSCSDRKYTFTSFRTSERAPGLQPVGPEYCPRPNTTNRFIVKMSAGFQVEEDVTIVPSYEIRLYDRSLTIDGKLTDADQIYHLVQRHGVMGQLYSYWKKLFMWVKGPEDGKLRVFINDFPAYQHW
jgi:parallel beta-helix repeat protein